MSVEYNCVLIRFGEIFLKGNNRKYFEDLLINNIKSALKPFKYTFLRSQGRYYIEDFENIDEIVPALTKVFGIHSVSPALKVKTDKETLFEAAVKMSPMSGKFRVTVKRADKRLPFTSEEMAGNIGGALLRASGGKLKVDLFDHDFDLHVDIRDNGYSYLFYDKIPGAGGLPVGCSGNGMLLLSGGIDSPVAGWLMAKRGVRLHAIHFHSFPYTGEPALQKVKDLAEKLSRYTGQVNLHVVPFTAIQYAIHENCPASFMITIMRRFMMRIAEKIAKKEECGAIITGESLGQVASQTMQSMNVTNSVVKLPVFRPVVGFDKEEIIDIAKKIDTFEISIRPYEDCCTVFLPKNPVIRPKISDAEEYERALDVETLVDQAVAGTEELIITPMHD